MNCQETRKWMSPYLDSELGSTKTFELREHLRTCPECMGRFEAERRADETIRTQLSKDAMPEDLWSRIEASVSTPSWVRVLRGRRYWAMAACLVLAVSGVMLARRAGGVERTPLVVQQFVSETPGNRPFVVVDPGQGAATLESVLRDTLRLAMTVPLNIETMGHKNFQVVSTMKRKDTDGREFVEVRLNCCGEPILLVLAKSAGGKWPLNLDPLADDVRQARGFDGVNVGARDLGDVRAVVASRHSIQLILAALSQLET